MTTLRNHAAFLGLVVFLMAGDGTSATTRTLPGALPLEGITFITITNTTFKAEEDSWLVRCEDQGLIEKLAVVIREGKPSRDHKCSDIGIITFHFKQGKTVQLGILPGHDEKFYQFRLREDGEYSIYQADRSVFLDALEAVGCPVNDKSFPR